MEETIAKAKEFIQRNARLLERLRYSYLFEDGPKAAVLGALDAYQNEDGGYGNALEPDLRGPESQPIPAWAALGLLDELRSVGGTRVRKITGYLEKIETKGGGVPFVLPSANQSPHAPWWDSKARKPPGSINPTAGIAALLHKNGVPSSWLTRADRWCWKYIEQMQDVNPYEMRVTLSFLDHVPDRARAARQLERLRPKILAKGVVEMDVDSKAEVFRPLDYAPNPDSLSRSLFSDKEMDRQLDGLERAQAPDGGWTINFPIWTPITEFEWRGVQTVEMLKVLQMNGRLGP
ncbi:MAG: hypothetical protein WAN87_03745 [Thermoplasmata archaeon]